MISGMALQLSQYFPHDLAQLRQALDLAGIEVDHDVVGAVSMNILAHLLLLHRFLAAWVAALCRARFPIVFMRRFAEAFPALWQLNAPIIFIHSLVPNNGFISGLT